MRKCLFSFFLSLLLAACINSYKYDPIDNYDKNNLGMNFVLLSGGVIGLDRRCGGFIVDYHIVISAGHCLIDKGNANLTRGYTMFGESFNIVGKKFITETTDIGFIITDKPLRHNVVKYNLVPNYSTGYQYGACGLYLSHIARPAIYNNRYKNVLISKRYYTVDGWYLLQESCPGDSGGVIIQNNRLSGIMVASGSVGMKKYYPMGLYLYTVPVSEFIIQLEKFQNDVSITIDDRKYTQ